MHVLARFRRARGFFLVLAIAAMAIRGAIPAGFMVSATVDGAAIELCTGGADAGVALHAIAAASDNSHPGAHRGADRGGDHNNSRDHAPCAFAAAATLAHATTPDMLLAPLRYAAAILPVVTFVQPGLGLAAPPPPARGPPSFL